MLEAWGLHDASNYRTFARTVDELGKSIRVARVLDIGCGSNAPMTIILHSMDVRVTELTKRSVIVLLRKSP